MRELEPRATTSSEKWVKSLEMFHISWRKLKKRNIKSAQFALCQQQVATAKHFPWIELAVYWCLTWKRTLQLQAWSFEKAWEIRCQLVRASDRSWNRETHEKVVRLGKSEWFIRRIALSSFYYSIILFFISVCFLDYWKSRFSHEFLPQVSVVFSPAAWKTDRHSFHHYLSWVLVDHFRVPKTLTFKMRPSAQPFL